MHAVMKTHRGICCEMNDEEYFEKCLTARFIFFFFFPWSTLHHSRVFVRFVNTGMYREQKLRSKNNIYHSLEPG
jgi:hypothetical protein